MAIFDEQLQEIHEKLSQKKSIEAKRKELEAQKKELEAKVSELRTVMLNEQDDVTKLEGRSLTAFFYYVIGKMDDKLSKEREEAYAAAIKHDSAVGELNAVETDIKKFGIQLYELRNCEFEYKKLLEQKQEALKQAGTPEAAELLAIEENIASLNSQQKEIKEAISAGMRARSIIESIEKHLSDAEGWGTWDMLGGGLLTDLAKHSHLDEAQKKIEELQIQLRRFKTELADVKISADVHISIDGFLRFADYFFDGLIADWTVMDKISQAQSEVESVKRKVENMLSRLEGMRSTAERKVESEKARMDAIVLGAKI